MCLTRHKFEITTSDHRVTIIAHMFLRRMYLSSFSVSTSLNLGVNMESQDILRQIETALK